jgi:hypothetical protein
MLPVTILTGSATLLTLAAGLGALLALAIIVLRMLLTRLVTLVLTALALAALVLAGLVLVRHGMLLELIDTVSLRAPTLLVCRTWGLAWARITYIPQTPLDSPSAPRPLLDGAQPLPQFPDAAVVVLAELAGDLAVNP